MEEGIGLSWYYLPSSVILVCLLPSAAELFSGWSAETPGWNGSLILPAKHPLNPLHLPMEAQTHMDRGVKTGCGYETCPWRWRDVEMTL